MVYIVISQYVTKFIELLLICCVALSGSHNITYVEFQGNNKNQTVSTRLECRDENDRHKSDQSPAVGWALLCHNWTLFVKSRKNGF